MCNNLSAFFRVYEMGIGLDFFLVDLKLFVSSSEEDLFNIFVIFKFKNCKIKFIIGNVEFFLLMLINCKPFEQFVHVI